MHVVIDMPEELYEALSESSEIIISGQRSGKTLMSVLVNAVANGTPLPKGHGRIGDFDAFLKGFLFDKRADNLECGWIRELIEQTTIIQADKEE